MNWYTTIYKLAFATQKRFAFPVMEKQNPLSTYEDFRHEGDDPDYIQEHVSLWFIDTNFNFYMIPVVRKDQTPWDWGFFRNKYEGKQVVYQGRYDENKHKASMTRNFWQYIDPTFKQVFYQREDKLQEKAERVVDKNLNNPTIMVF